MFAFACLAPPALECASFGCSLRIYTHRRERAKLKKPLDRASRLVVVSSTAGSCIYHKYILCRETIRNAKYLIINCFREKMSLEVTWAKTRSCSCSGPALCLGQLWNPNICSMTLIATTMNLSILANVFLVLSTKLGEQISNGSTTMY